MASAFREFLLTLREFVVSFFSERVTPDTTKKTSITTKSPIAPKDAMPIILSNTRTGSKDEFVPSFKPVRMYNCGPTVYGVQHIGNLSMYVFTDVLRKTLEYNGYTVKQIINITDFGHLTSDADEGEDKMTKGLKAAGMEVSMENMTKLAEKFTQIFLDNIKALNVPVDAIEFPRASAYIPAEIAMIQTLEEKGYAYRAKAGVYFDTKAFKGYGALGNINTEGQQEGARVAVDTEKKNPTDFILWKSSAYETRSQNAADARRGKSDDRGVSEHTTMAADGTRNAAAGHSESAIGWQSPWGMGFPGWHIECSAMIRSTLGEQIDIHTGGIEHIPIHHNNEIAQSEAATGKRPFAKYWLHRAHLQINSEKIAKSTGNTVYLDDLVQEGFHPLAFRYWLLTSHYKTSTNFTKEALQGAQTAFLRLHRIMRDGKQLAKGTGTLPKEFVTRFHERINDDLDTAGALSVVWEMMKDEKLSAADIVAALTEFDRVLGIGLTNPDEKILSMLRSAFGEDMQVSELPEDVQKLIQERTEARTKKDWKLSDELRDKILEKGFDIKDTKDGVQVMKK